MNLYRWSRVPSNLSPIYQMVHNKFIYRVLRHIHCKFINPSLIRATQFLHALCKSLWKISQISIIVSQSQSLMMVHLWFPCIVFVLNVLLMFQTRHVFQNLFKKKPYSPLYINVHQICIKKPIIFKHMNKDSRETINITFGFSTVDGQALDQPQNSQFDLEVEVVSSFNSKFHKISKRREWNFLLIRRNLLLSFKYFLDNETCLKY
jgi:hypothetical protein